jgi:hypothetical protein
MRPIRRDPGRSVRWGEIGFIAVAFRCPRILTTPRMRRHRFKVERPCGDTEKCGIPSSQTHVHGLRYRLLHSITFPCSHSAFH